MATPHHQLSPQAAMHHHPHRRPPPHQAPNGHPQYPAPAAQHTPQPAAQPPPGPPPASSPLEVLARVNEQAWLAIGHCAERMGVNNVAVESYDRALRFNPTSVEALHSIASVLKNEDKYDSAVEYLQQIIKLEPANGESWSALGHCFLMMDELQKAYGAYQSALYNLNDPKEPKLWYGIGILYDRYGSLEHAEEAFSQVMRMAPDFDKANEIYFRLGIIYKQQSKFQESLECFQWIANNPPAPLNQTDILFQIGHVYEQQGDFESAKGAYRRVLERDPHHAKVLQQLGWLHHQESTEYNAQEKAIEFLEKSVNSDQNDAQSWYLLGRCYMSQQKYPKAYEAYQQAVYRDGRNPTFWCSIGVLYYQINQYRDALDAYSRAIRLNPNISEVWYDLGTLYQSCNNQTNDAVDAYQRAAELDPNNPHIKSRLQALKNQHASGQPGANGASIAQDGNPSTYEPAATNGPPPPSWASSMAQQGSHMRGPPSQPVAPPRDWPQRGLDGHGPPPHQAGVGAYPPDPRDMGRGPPPPPPAPPSGRPHSPRMEHVRHAESHRYTPTQRPVSPSPRMHSSVPRPPHPGMPPQGPPAPMTPHQQGHAPPNRMANPNYGPGLPPAGQPGGNALPPYGRPNSPPPPPRPLQDSRPRSPRSAAYGPPQTLHTPYQTHAETPSILNQAGAPPGAHAAEQAAREREREERIRTPASMSSSKRHREFEDRGESPGVHKRSATEEARSRLEDPYSSRRGPSPTPLARSSQYHHADQHRDRERERERERDREQERQGERERERVQYGPAPIGRDSAAQSNASSPSAARRREEDQKRADEEYKPSEAAHHPASLPPAAVQEAQPARAATPHEPSPTITPEHVKTEAPKRESPRPMESNGPADGEKSNEQDVPKQSDGSPKSTPQKDQDGDVRMQQAEEPAMRKMDVNEDYDEESGEEAPSKPAAPPSAAEEREKAADGSKNGSGVDSGEASPKSSAPTSAPAQEQAAEA